MIESTIHFFEGNENNKVLELTVILFFVIN